MPKDDIKLVIVCSDVIGPRMAGSAIRSVEIARALRGKYRVTLVAPHVDSNVKLPFEVFETNQLEFRRKAFEADVILLQGNALVRFPFLKRVSAVLVADLYCPLMLEYHQQSEGVNEQVRSSIGAYVTRIMAEQLVYCDYFICASLRQRDFWAGALAISGRINSIRWPIARSANISDVIGVVPFGLPDVAPLLGKPLLREKFGIPEDAFVAVWGGGIYDWLDPLTIIEAVGMLSKTECPVHLVFLGVAHPNPDIQQHRRALEAIDLAKKLGIFDRFVHFNFGWVSFDERQNFLLDATIGVSAHFDNPETRFSFRTRILDYLWCGLPIITTDGDTFADLVKSEKLGIVVDFEDSRAWAEALSRLARDRDYLATCSRRASRVSEEYRWSEVIRPMETLIDRVSIASDRAFARKYFRSRRVSLGLLARVRYIYASRGGGAFFLIIFRRIAKFFWQK